MKKVLLFITLLFIPIIALAHEAYVLPEPFFWEELLGPINFGTLEALHDPHNLLVTLEITGAILLFIFLNFIFRQSGFGKKAHTFIEKFSSYGPVIVRISIALAFFFGALSGAFLGPELPISLLPFAEVMRFGLYVSSVMILFGFFTEVAALIGLVVFTTSFFAFGSYLVTYLNYLGELIALFLFGTRRWSIDSLLFGKLKGWRRALESYETLIMRVFYGVALIYAAITVKFLHPAISLKVVNDFDLTQFYLLFPGDPLLVVFGAAMAEVAIGLFILIGFEMRAVILVSLFYITLSLLFFGEAVWPHILLYGISFNLLVQPEALTLDHLIFERHRKSMAFWKRPFSSKKTLESKTAQ